MPKDRAEWPRPSADTFGALARSDAERLRRRAAVLRDVDDARLLRARLTPRLARIARLRALRSSALGG